MDRGFAAVANDIADIKSTMATKADVRAIVRDELAPIRSELKSISRDLDDVRENVENVIGFQGKSITRWSASPRSKSTSASIKKSRPNRHHQLLRHRRGKADIVAAPPRYRSEPGARRTSWNSSQSSRCIARSVSCEEHQSEA
jgi:hypothetical protein